MISAPRYCTSITTSAGPRLTHTRVPTQNRIRVRWNRPRRLYRLNMYRFSVQCIGHGRSDPDDTRYRRQWMAWKVDRWLDPGPHTSSERSSQTVVCVPSGSWKHAVKDPAAERFRTSVKLRVLGADRTCTKDDRRCSSHLPERWYAISSCRCHALSTSTASKMIATISSGRVPQPCTNTIESLDATEDRCSLAGSVQLVYESRTIGTKSVVRVVIGYDRHGGG
jgi:hypothetical protein